MCILVLECYPMQDAEQYRQIGEQLYLKYPCIRFPTGAEPWGTDLDKEVALIHYLEKTTAFNKGKGVKTNTVLKVKQDVTETETENSCQTREKTPLHIIASISDESKLQDAVIVGENVAIFCKTDKLLNALLFLVMTYYVMDLEYPRQYSLLLGLLLIWDQFDGKISSKFSKYCTYLDEELKK